MSDTEHAIRLTAWTWAVDSLGIEATPERIDGLVELTEGVAAEHLREAIKDAMKANPSSYIPAVSAVISAGNRLAGKRREAKQRALEATRRDQALISSGNSKMLNRTVEELREKIRMGAEREKSAAGNRKGMPPRAEREQMSDSTLAAVRKVSRLSDDEKAEWLAKELRAELERNSSR